MGRAPWTLQIWVVFFNKKIKELFFCLQYRAATSDRSSGWYFKIVQNEIKKREAQSLRISSVISGDVLDPPALMLFLTAYYFQLVWAQTLLFICRGGACSPSDVVWLVPIATSSWVMTSPAYAHGSSSRANACASHLVGCVISLSCCYVGLWLWCFLNFYFFMIFQNKSWSGSFSKLYHICRWWLRRWASSVQPLY
jgi:hypothetical protein